MRVDRGVFRFLRHRPVIAGAVAVSAYGMAGAFMFDVPGRIKQAFSKEEGDWILEELDGVEPHSWVPLCPDYPNLKGKTCEEIQRFKEPFAKVLKQAEEIDVKRQKLRKERDSLAIQEGGLQDKINEVWETSMKGFGASTMQTLGREVPGWDEAHGEYLDKIRPLKNKQGDIRVRLRELQSEIDTLSAQYRDIAYVLPVRVSDLENARDLIDWDYLKYVKVLDREEVYAIAERLGGEVDRLYGREGSIFVTTPRGGYEFLSIFAYANGLSKELIPSDIREDVVRDVEEVSFATIKDWFKGSKPERVVYWLDQVERYLGKKDRDLGKAEDYIVRVTKLIEDSGLFRIENGLADLGVLGSREVAPNLAWRPIGGYNRLTLNDYVLTIEVLEKSKRGHTWLGGRSDKIERVFVVDDIIASGAQMYDTDQEIKAEFGSNVEVIPVVIAARIDEGRDSDFENPYLFDKTIAGFQTLGRDIWRDRQAESVEKRGRPLSREENIITTKFPWSHADGRAEQLLTVLYGRRDTGRRGRS